MAADYLLEGPKWGPSASRGTTGGTVTWSYTSAISAAFQNEIQTAFNDWAAVANITFSFVQNPAGAMIDIGFAAIDGLSNVLGYTNYSYAGSSLQHADVTFDSAEPWTASSNGLVAFGNDYFEALALHEIGHAIGLDHYNSLVAVMNSYLPSNLHSLTQSDIDGAAALYGAPPSAYKAVGSGDFDHDGLQDLLFQNQATASVATWDSNPGHILGTPVAGYQVVGTGDFNHDGTSDVLLSNAATGYIYEWIVSAGKIAIEAGIGRAPAGYHFAATGDLNHDGTTDILFQNQAGSIAEWLISNGHLSMEAGLGVAPANFAFVCVGDLNGDGVTDLAFQNPQTGYMAEWQVANGHVAIEAGLGYSPTGFKFAAAGDFNHDGTTDLLFQNAGGYVAEWIMSQGHLAVELGLGTLQPGLQIAGVADVNHDETPDLLTQNGATGAFDVWNMSVGRVAGHSSVDWTLA